MIVHGLWHRVVSCGYVVGELSWSLPIKLLMEKIVYRLLQLCNSKRLLCFILCYSYPWNIEVAEKAVDSVPRAH